MGIDPHIKPRYDRLAPFYGALHWFNTLGQDRAYRQDAVQVLSDLLDGSSVSNERDIKGVFGGLRKVLKDLWTHPQNPVGPQRDLDDVIIGDYGSGQGHMTQHLYETMGARGAQVVALDGSQGMLKRAQGDRVQGSMYAVPLKHNTLDAVVMSYSAGSAEDTAHAAAEAYRTLKPGGYLVVVDAASPKKDAPVLVRMFKGLLGKELDAVWGHHYVDADSFEVEGFERLAEHREYFIVGSNAVWAFRKPNDRG